MPGRGWTWISPTDPDAEYWMVSTQATLRHRRELPRFLFASQTLWSHLESADGLIGYRLDLSLLGRSLATLSAWRSEESMLAFARGRAHADVVSLTRPLITDSRVRSWVTSGARVPGDGTEPGVPRYNRPGPQGGTTRGMETGR